MKMDNLSCLRVTLGNFGKVCELFLAFIACVARLIGSGSRQQRNIHDWDRKPGAKDGSPASSSAGALVLARFPLLDPNPGRADVPRTVWLAILGRPHFKDSFRVT